VSGQVLDSQHTVIRGCQVVLRNADTDVAGLHTLEDVIEAASMPELSRQSAVTA
jgi:hypothetical protein